MPARAVLSVAMLAAMSGTALGQTWAVNGANIYSLGSKVGVGTVNPVFGKFEVRSAGTSDSVISVYGINAGTTGQTRGMYGEVFSTDGIGFVGINNATTGVARAMYGESHGDAGVGGYFIANSATGTPRGVYGEAINASSGIGVFGIGANIGVQGQSLVPGVGWAGVFYGNTYTSGNSILENGRVGIGTTGPLDALHIRDGDLRIERTGFNQIAAINLSTPLGDNYIQADATLGNLAISTASPSRNLVLQGSGGSVGIGTIPQARFHVKNNGNFDARLEGTDESVVTLRLLETVGGLGDYGGLIRYDGSGNQLRIGTVANTTETIAMNIARGSSNVAVVGTLTTGGAATIGGALSIGGNLDLPGSVTINFGGRGHIQTSEILYLNPFAGNQQVVVGGGGGTGNMFVAGTLAKAGGSFKIDHPLDPANKYLYHSFVESPDMKNIYDGTVVTDERGYATVTLPDYFEALNRDFRYQLTVVDDGDTGSWVMVKVAHKIENRQFVIHSSSGNVEVSWQVTGTRRDAWAENHRIPNAVEKTGEEKGKYLHPEVFGQPVEMGVHYRRANESAPAVSEAVTPRQ
jgi:hypothetical protein